ncbi:MAG: hypothetical protein EBV84_06090 [Betaproteobacteria bacterium]|nr:hypothetical protein [Betaproteobacteria bacterium]
MSEKVAVGVIGLGAVGTRSLSYLLDEPALLVRAIWDPSDQAHQHHIVARAIAAGARFAVDAADVRIIFILLSGFLARFNGCRIRSLIRPMNRCWPMAIKPRPPCLHRFAVKRGFLFRSRRW